MKATIKLQEVTKLKLGTDLAKLTLTLESAIGHKSSFSLESTGISLVVTSQNHISDLIQLCDWLRQPSNDDSNMRDNEAELKIFSQEMINTQKKLNQAKTL